VLIEASTPAGTKGLAALLAHPDCALVAFDYDGTLAPIVEDPAQARPLPGIVAAVAGLSRCVGAVAVVTGRPARTAVGLAGLADVPGLEDLVVLGHYGLERWDARTGKVTGGADTEAVERARDEVPALLDRLDLAGAAIEDKGLSVAVHVRRLPDPAGAFARIREPLAELAGRLGLTAEPGRMVVELRPSGMDKGRALGGLADSLGAETVMYAGDDLGDLAAFDEVDRRREAGSTGVLVCSGSTEVSELADRADVVVTGPAGVLELVESLRSLLDPSRVDV